VNITAGTAQAYSHLVFAGKKREPLPTKPSCTRGRRKAQRCKKTEARNDWEKKESKGGGIEASQVVKTRGGVDLDQHRTRVWGR